MTHIIPKPTPKQRIKDLEKELDVFKKREQDRQNDQRMLHLTMTIWLEFPMLCEEMSKYDTTNSNEQTKQFIDSLKLLKL